MVDYSEINPVVVVFVLTSCCPLISSPMKWVQVNSLVVAGWAGLIINALACIPAGETDGGRITTAIFGRQV
jgi:membrane-associated protease RseP (regulator of RpoE activity)